MTIYIYIYASPPQNLPFGHVESMNNLQRQVCKPQTCLHIYLFELQGWCMTLTQMKYIILHDRRQKWIGRQQDA